MRPWRAAHLMRQTQLQHVSGNGDCLVVLGPKNNLAFDYKNEREFALKLPRPLAPFSFPWEVPQLWQELEQQEQKHTNKDWQQRNPPHIAHDVNVVVAFKNFVLMCLLQAALQVDFFMWTSFSPWENPPGSVQALAHVLTLKFKVQICNFQGGKLKWKHRTNRFSNF